MLRKSVLELSSRLSTKRFPKNLGAQRFHLSSSSRRASTSGSGNNGFPGANPSKVDPPNMAPPPPPPPPVGKPDEPKGNSSKVVLGGVALFGAVVVAYQTGYLDEYLGKETEKLGEKVKSDPVLQKLEEAAQHLNVKEDSTGISKVETTQPEVTHSEASKGMQSEREVQPESDLTTPDRFTYSSSNKEETSQESGIDREAERSLPVSSDDNSVSEDSRTKSDTSSKIVSEAESVRLEDVPKPEDSTIVSAQSRESETESALPKEPATEKAPEDGIEREVEMLGSLLKEYNLEVDGTESTESTSVGDQLTKETEALPNSAEGLKGGYMTEDGKLHDFITVIHSAEKRQARIDAQIFAEELRAMEEKYENELRDLRARELMRIEEAAILDKELKRERTKAAATIKTIQERMEDKLKTEIEQKETEAQLALSKAEELAKAELISAIAKEKAAQIEKMAEADLNIKALCMAFYARSEEARQSHSVHKLALGALALDDALSKGLPIQKEIDMLQSHLEGGIHKDSILDLVVSSLPEEARSNGTETVLQLNQKFDNLKGTLRHYSLIPPGGGGILAHSLAQIASWLKFKEVEQANNNNNGGKEGIETVIKKVDNYLAEGKLAEAATTLEEGVKGSKAEEIVSDWVKLARNRAITEQAISLLQSYATCLNLTS